MKAEEFIAELEDDIEHSKRAFVENLKGKDFTYCEWIQTFIAWMEWASEEDCISFHGDN